MAQDQYDPAVSFKVAASVGLEPRKYVDVDGVFQSVTVDLRVMVPWDTVTTPNPELAHRLREAVTMLAATALSEIESRYEK